MRTAKDNAIALFSKKQKLNHVMSVKTDTLNCSSFPGFIQCEGTSFLVSFPSSAGKKKRCFHFSEFTVSKHSRFFSPQNLYKTVV